MTDRDAALGTLEERAPVLFLVAGGLMVVFAVNTYLKTFTGTSYPVVQGVVAPVGFLAGVVGLFGLYAGFDGAPTLARSGAVVAAVATAGWVVLIGASVVLGGEPAGPLSVVPLVTIAAMVLAFALFGLASLRSGVHSRVVGVLLLVESLMFLLVVAGVPGYLIDTGHVLAYLGIGLALRTGAVPADRAEPAPDSTA